jgi:hypothetical protein
LWWRRLKLLWSPEQIAGRRRPDDHDLFASMSMPTTAASSSAATVFAPLPKRVDVGAGPSDVVAGL